MQFDTAYNHREKAIQRLRDCYSTARIVGYTSDQLNNKVLSIVFEPIAKCPTWVKTEVKGYWRALQDKAYENDLVFGAVIDGVFYSTHSNRPDYYEKHGISALEFNLDLENNNAGHYWIEPLDYGRIKPFFH